MDDKITTIKDRVLQVAKYKGIRLELFLQEIGMSYSSFKGESKKTPLNSEAIVNILSKYPDVSPDWLLTDNGPMIRSGEPVAGQESQSVEERLFAIIREKDERIEAQARKIGQLEGRLDARYEQSEFLAGRNVKSAVPHVPVGTRPELSDNPVIPASERVTGSQ